jgi:glucuronoarabinoxylan endo-1,4-beta-xylanase
MRDFIRDHGQTITATRLMAPECASNNQNYLNTILSDPGAVANLDIAAGHIYGGGVTENQLAKSLGKEVWMTEHLDTNITYAANINTALEIHDCLTKANFNAYIWWYGKRFYGPIGQDGLVTKRGFVLSQFARFIKPGSVRLGVGVNSRSDVFISAYQHGTKRILVAINTGPGDVNQTISIDTGTLSAMVPYTTTELKNVEQGNPITASGNSIKVLLPHRSITTLVEQ